jgi:hypothetical protein
MPTTTTNDSDAATDNQLILTEFLIIISKKRFSFRKS